MNVERELSVLEVRPAAALGVDGHEVDQVTVGLHDADLTKDELFLQRVVQDHVRSPGRGEWQRNRGQASVVFGSQSVSGIVPGQLHEAVDLECTFKTNSRRPVVTISASFEHIPDA